MSYRHANFQLKRLTRKKSDIKKPEQTFQHESENKNLGAVDFMYFASGKNERFHRKKQQPK